ncbi:Apoptogenic protein 1 [Mactra antiquata]
MSACMRIQKCQQMFVSLEGVGIRREIHLTYSRLKVKTKKGSTEITSPSPAPQNVKCDWIGPPDKLSNIRQIKFFVPECESLVEKQFREKRQSAQEFHHAFWSEHNKEFFTLKEKFTQEKLAEKKLENPDATVKSLTPEEMSEFYKQFLDDNRKNHMQYNREWYKQNFQMLLSAFKVFLYRLSSSVRKSTK